MSVVIAALDKEPLVELTGRFNAAMRPETRLRYQMVLLSQQGLFICEIANITIRSHDMVTRVPHRYLDGGWGAVPRRKQRSRTRTVTPDWEAELLRVIELDPHQVCAERDLDNQAAGRVLGPQDRHPGRARGRAFVPASSGLRLQATNLVYEAQGPGKTGLSGKSIRVEALLKAATAPEPLPIQQLVASDLLDQVPPVVGDLSALLPKADLYLQDEVQFGLHPTLTRIWCRKGRAGQRRVEACGNNEKAHRFGLVDWRDGWFEGAIAPRRTAPPFVEQLRRAVARSEERGRIAIVLADNACTHTPEGSLLVRQLLADREDRLRIVYTPRYDPDSQPIEELWGVSRRIVSHGHPRADLDTLTEDAKTHFDCLTDHRANVLCHIGGPSADPSQAAPQCQINT